jgi:DNA modification methylase
MAKKKQEEPAAAPVLRLVYMDPNELAENPANWRRHPENQINALTDVISEVGWAGACLLNERTGRLIDGHARRKVALEQGATKVPVLVGDWTEEQEKKILATLDPLAAMAEADTAALDALLREVSTGSEALGAMLTELAEKSGVIPAIPEPGNGGDDFDPTPDTGPTRCKAGDLWVIGGKHRLLVGDCTDAGNVKRLMEKAQAEMVWTDPPYGVSIGDKNVFLNSIAPCNRIEENLQNDSLDEPALIEMLRKSFANAVEHCTAGASWYVAAPAGPLHLLFGQALKELGIWRQTIQWVKNNSTFSPMGVSYHWKSEPIFYGWIPNGGHRYYGDRKQTTVWEFDRPMASPDHPTMKPIPLVMQAIEHASQHNELVYDPFLGSGTTLIAAHRLNRICYGCEIEPKYGDVILRRAEAEGMTVEKVG